jgi:hypothetical protein
MSPDGVCNSQLYVFLRLWPSEFTSSLCVLVISLENVSFGTCFIGLCEDWKGKHLEQFLICSKCRTCVNSEENIISMKDDENGGTKREGRWWSEFRPVLMRDLDWPKRNELKDCWAMLRGQLRLSVIYLWRTWTLSSAGVFRSKGEDNRQIGEVRIGIKWVGLADSQLDRALDLLIGIRISTTTGFWWRKKKYRGRIVHKAVSSELRTWGAL